MAQYDGQSGIFYMDTQEDASSLATQLNSMLYEPFIARGGHIIAANVRNEEGAMQIVVPEEKQVHISESLSEVNKYVAGYIIHELQGILRPVAESFRINDFNPPKVDAKLISPVPKNPDQYFKDGDYLPGQNDFPLHGQNDFPLQDIDERPIVEFLSGAFPGREVEVRFSDMNYWSAPGNATKIVTENAERAVAIRDALKDALKERGIDLGLATNMSLRPYIVDNPPTGVPPAGVPYGADYKAGGPYKNEVLIPPKLADHQKFREMIQEVVRQLDGREINIETGKSSGNATLPTGKGESVGRAPETGPRDRGKQC